jgi:diphthine synthase
MIENGLYLVGIGPGNLDLMTKQAIEICRSAKIRFLEGYTSTLPKESEDILENLVGKWDWLMRPEMENSENLLELTKENSVVIMVVGDPMTATTHVDIRMRCIEEEIPFSYIPGISAISLAISSSGLQSYRFGRQVTITYQYGEYLPTSPLSQLLENKKRGLHTLALLDLDPTGMGVNSPIHMKPNEAGELLIAMAHKMSENENLDSLIDWDVLVCSDLGTTSSVIIPTTIGGLEHIKTGRIHCLIIPGKMHEMEKITFELLKNHS